MQNFKKHKIITLNGFFGTMLFFAAAICILGCSSSSSYGALSGLKASSSIIIPSLFPFTVISVFFEKSGGLLWISKKINNLSYKILKLNGTEFSVLLLSLIGGYPIGAKIIEELHKSGNMTKDRAKQLFVFCISASPAFFISVIGINIFRNSKIGLVLFFSNLLSTLLLCLLFRNKDSNKAKISNTNLNHHSITDAFVESVFSASQIIINICAFVILFSSISEIIKPIFINNKIYNIFCPLLEITFGITKLASTNIPPYLYSFFLCFSGISTILQIKQIAKNTAPPLINLAFFRLTHGAISTIISFVIFKLFPISINVISNGIEITFKEFPLFLPSIALIIFSILFLLFLSPTKENSN